MNEETIPEDIPNDIWLTACDVAHDVFDADCDLMETGTSSANPALMISRAILAERERCAKIADAHKRVQTTLDGNGAAKLTAQSIAFDIRNPDSAP